MHSCAECKRGMHCGIVLVGQCTSMKLNYLVADTETFYDHLRAITGRYDVQEKNAVKTVSSHKKSLGVIVARLREETQLLEVLLELRKLIKKMCFFGKIIHNQKVFKIFSSSRSVCVAGFPLTWKTA